MSETTRCALNDISTAEVSHWLENCCVWLDEELTAESRAVRMRQIRLLREELQRRGTEPTHE